jgi:hypothetical protein
MSAILTPNTPRHARRIKYRPAIVPPRTVGVRPPRPRSWLHATLRLAALLPLLAAGAGLALTILVPGVLIALLVFLPALLPAFLVLFGLFAGGEVSAA